MEGGVLITGVIVVDRLLHWIVRDVRTCAFARLLHIPAKNEASVFWVLRRMEFRGGDR